MNDSFDLNDRKIIHNREYKIIIIILKILPIVCATGYAANSLLSYFDIDVAVLGYLIHISLIPLIFFYFAAHVFRFCAYHRMFLHYIIINEILNIIDLSFGSS